MEDSVVTEHLSPSTYPPPLHNAKVPTALFVGSGCLKHWGVSSVSDRVRAVSPYRDGNTCSSFQSQILHERCCPTVAPSISAPILFIHCTQCTRKILPSKCKLGSKERVRLAVFWLKRQLWHWRLRRLKDLGKLSSKIFPFTCAITAVDLCTSVAFRWCGLFQWTMCLCTRQSFVRQRWYNVQCQPINRSLRRKSF